MIRLKLAQFMVPGRHRMFSTAPLLWNEHPLTKIPPQRIRNIGIIAHIDAGKTTTTERMLFYSGKINKIGNVDEGDTVTDYMSQERDRGITIQLAATSIPWNNHMVNIIDTPGHVDFTFEVIRSLRVLDGAVLILDAVAGVEAQSETVFRQATSNKVPCVCYVNKMDRPGAGFSRSVQDIIKKFGCRVILCNIPYFSKDNDRKFLGIIDVVHKKILKWKPEDETGTQIEVINIEDDNSCDPQVYDECFKAREWMIESLCEQNEALLEEFFQTEDYMAVSAEAIQNAIRDVVRRRVILPVFCGSSFTNIGVQPLMDAITMYLPSPLEVPVPTVFSDSSKHSKKGNRLKNSPENTRVEVDVQVVSEKGIIFNKNPKVATAFAFKVITHPQRGPMTFIRVYSGNFTTGHTFKNTRTGESFKLGKLLVMHGDSPEPISSLGIGSIGVIPGMGDEIRTGDTLVSMQLTQKGIPPLESNLKLMPLKIPEPVFSANLEPNTAGDKRYMEESIQLLIREDPSLFYKEDEDSGQLILSGMGELHLEIAGDRLVRDFKAKCKMGTIDVSYKEALCKKTKNFTVETPEGVSCTIELDTYDADETELDFDFVDIGERNIVTFDNDFLNKEMKEAISNRRWKSENTPEQLQDAIIQGCIGSLQIGGPLASLPINSTMVRVLNWSFPYTSTNVSATALLHVTRKAILQALEQASSDSRNFFTILEPMMDCVITCDNSSLGEVMKDLTTYRKAIIDEVEDTEEASKSALWIYVELDKCYFPPDYTISKGGDKNIEEGNNKRVKALVPLREMLGYLSKIRSLTQGRGTLDMTYKGLRLTLPDRREVILNAL